MPTILIVDDDAVDREQAARCLRSIEDLEVQEARDGGEALSALGLRAPDLVLTDLRMPGMDGLELVRAIGEAHPSVPVVLMTSQGSEQIAVRALKAGAASYVPKSDLKDELTDTVRQVLEIASTGRSRRRIVECLDRSEMRFELRNDPTLIAPLVGFLQESLGRFDFCVPAARTQIGMALDEAVSNAMIHGNLEVSSEVRDQGGEGYHRLIKERGAMAPYAERRVHLTARESPARVDYVIEDDGPGFDVASLSRADESDNLLRVRGRGLILIRAFMDAVVHNARGNQITLTKHGTTRPIVP